MHRSSRGCGGQPPLPRSTQPLAVINSRYSGLSRRDSGLLPRHPHARLTVPVVWNLVRAIQDRAMAQTQPAAPIHPQARAILDRIVGSGEPPLETLTAEQARAVADPRVIRTAGKGPEVAAVDDRA